MFALQASGVVVTGLPPGVLTVVLGSVAMILALVIGIPLVRAVGKRIARGTAESPPAIRGAELDSLRRSVDRLSIEVERISEGQRWMLRETGDASGSRGGPDAD